MIKYGAPFPNEDRGGTFRELFKKKDNPNMEYNELKEKWLEASKARIDAQAKYNLDESLLIVDATMEGKINGGEAYVKAKAHIQSSELWRAYAEASRLEELAHLDLKNHIKNDR